MFISELKKTINTGKARAIILTGNVYDLFFDGESYVPLLEYISKKCEVKSTETRKGLTQLLHKLNNPIECRGNEEELEKVWRFYHRNAPNSDIKTSLGSSNSNTSHALELMRQISECYRRSRSTRNNLLMVIESADMLIPENEINKMSMTDRQKVAILHDWFSEPDFVNGGDTVILLAESRSKINHRIANLPQVVSIDIPLPDKESREHFIKWHSERYSCEVSNENIGELTAGLSIHAIRQLLKSGDCSSDNIASKVESYMISQLGEGVIEFKRPKHAMKDVVGFNNIKKFMKKELIPGFLNGHISGAAVGGPIGSGKTFICEAVAAELGVPVIVLKNIRSKWYGETDQVFEKLKRLLETFSKSVIFVDEADSQFGAIDDGHATEKRLTGKIQAMMSDTSLKGRVIWFLMTARIHKLSPDIRRPGRMDLIIPILDPDASEREEFLEWCLGSDLWSLFKEDEQSFYKIKKSVEKYSAASFASLKSQIKMKKAKDPKSVLEICNDMVMPNIQDTRLYQTLQAKVNCTRKSLLFAQSDDTYDVARSGWRKQIQELEARGIH